MTTAEGGGIAYVGTICGEMKYRTAVIGKPGVNFINMLLAAFTHVDPKTANKYSKIIVFFALLGSACLKALLKTLMKLTPSKVNKESNETA